MHPLLESVYLKIQRAESHLESYKREADAFSRLQSHKVAVETERQTGDKPYKLVSRLDEPPPRLNTIIGDVLFNYRSALDHLMWALVLKCGNIPTYQTEFPIFNDSAKFRAARNVRETLRLVSPEIKAAIEREQPYHGTHDGDLLWWLYSLHNVDKHRHFNLVVSSYVGTFSMNAPIDIQRGIVDFTSVGRVPEGTPLARIPREYVGVDFYPALDIQFGEGTDAYGQFVRRVLGGIDTMIEDRLVSWFENLFSH